MADHLFVGRQNEQVRFWTLLGELDGAGRTRPGLAFGRKPSRPGEAQASTVILVHGPSGIGKSRLLRQFLVLAEQGQVPGGRARTAWVDWEDEVARTPVRYAGATGPALLAVLGAIRHSVVRTFSEDQLATGRVAEAFRPFDNGAGRMAEYVARVQDVIKRAGRPGSSCTKEDAAALQRTVLLAGLATVWHAPGLREPRPDESAGTGGALSAAAVEAVIKRKPDELAPAEYALVTDPATELAQRFASALAAIAERKPLVVFLDGVQVLGDRAREWLRLVMDRTGPRVAWVTGADSELSDLGEGRLTRMPLATFDETMIRACLEPGQAVTDEDTRLISRFTRGLPLAVSLIGPLLEDGLTVEQACRGTDAGESASTAVAEVARRYLEQAENQESGDAGKIRALALGHGSLRDDRDVLAVLWGTSEPDAAFDALASRCDFVIPATRNLHEGVKAALRTAMLDENGRNRVRPVNERALNWYLALLSSERHRWPALDEQVGQASFASALLGALWHATWVSSQDGLDLLAAVLPVLNVAQVHLADVAAGLMDQFEVTFSAAQLEYLDQLTVREEGRRRARITEAGLGFEPRQAQDEMPLVGQAGDREAAVHTLRARLQLAADHNEAAAASLLAAATATTSRRLGQVIGTQALAAAHSLTWPGSRPGAIPDEAGLAAAKLAVGLLPDLAAAWNCLAGASLAAGQCDEALAGYRRALELQPGDAMTLTNLGSVLRVLGRFDDSLAACGQAAAADRTSGFLAANLAIALRILGRFDEALAAADEGLVLDPGAADTHVVRGTILATTGRADEALISYEQALALDADNPAAHLNKGIALTVTGDLDQALNEFESATRLDRTVGAAGHAWTGAIHWHLGDTEAARAKFSLVRGQFTRRTPFLAAELEAIARCGLGEPDSAEQHLLAALPHRSPGDRAEPRTIYDLLANPPLPGIDRLRTIIDRA